MSEVELPQNVNEAVQQEYGLQPEGNLKTWNKKFNQIADKLQDLINESARQYVSVGKKLPYKDSGNVVMEMGKAYIRGAAGAAHGITLMEINVLKSLAELGAKATGGRVSQIDRPSNK